MNLKSCFSLHDMETKKIERILRCGLDPPSRTSMSFLYCIFGYNVVLLIMWFVSAPLAFIMSGLCCMATLYRKRKHSFKLYVKPCNGKI